jgi:hypothetical protein
MRFASESLHAEVEPSGPSIRVCFSLKGDAVGIGGHHLYIC